MFDVAGARYVCIAERTVALLTELFLEIIEQNPSESHSPNYECFLLSTHRFLRTTYAPPITTTDQITANAIMPLMSCPKPE